MKNFRKISFVFILTAMVMLTLHALVPHHHKAQQGTELICTTQHNPVHHCTQHKECVEEQGCCGEDVICGLSHIFTNSAVHPTVIIPIVITCQSIIPMPDVSQPCEEYIPSEAPLVARLIVRDVPLRAPPVV